MSESLKRLSRCGSWLVVVVVTVTSFPRSFAAEPTDAASHVVPIAWSHFRKPVDADEHLQRAARLLNNSCRVKVAWLESAHQIDPATGNYVIVIKHDPKRNRYSREPAIRPFTSIAYALATALKTGIYNEAYVGVSKQVALERTKRTIRSIAAIHKVNSNRKDAWGDNWQSALWTSGLGYGGWIIWDELDADTRKSLARVVEFEADRFIAPEYRVPYWANRDKLITPGDTKAEENAWNSNVLQVAVAMMPKHPHVSQWRAVCTQLMVSSYAKRSDLESNSTLIDGKPVKDWIEGYNVRDDGGVVNHGIMHPDYMTCVTMVARSYVAQSLARQVVSESAQFNGPMIYQVLSTTNWPAPPNRSPGGTIYVPGKAEIYYPQGTDWSPIRISNFYLLDIYAHLLGWDRDTPTKAERWMQLRSSRMLELQARHADGSLYEKGEFDRQPIAEQQLSASFAEGYLLLWLNACGSMGKQGNWLK